MGEAEGGTNREDNRGRDIDMDDTTLLGPGILDASDS